MTQEVLHHFRDLDSVADVDYVIDLVDAYLSLLVSLFEQEEELVLFVQADESEEGVCLDG